MWKQMAKWLAVLCCYAGVGLGGLAAQPQGKLGPDEMNFVNSTVTYTQMHTKLGRFAAEKTGSADVRRLAEGIVEDGNKLQKELVRLTAILGVPIPLAENNMVRTAMGRFNKLKSEDVDREYLRQLTVDQGEVVKLYEGQVKVGQSAELRALAAKWLPVLRKHLKETQELEKNVNKK